MDRSDFQKILTIKTYCEDISEYIQRFGNDYDVFLRDKAYFHAVSMCILQIGELANKLSNEFRDETKSQMPWGMIRAMRKWIARAYDEADDSIIWETATNSTPELLNFCKTIIDENHSYFSS